MDQKRKEWLDLTIGLSTFSVTTWRNKRPFNLVLACQNLQGDAELIAVSTVFWRSFKIEIGRSSFFDRGKHKWAEFDLRLFR